MTGACAPLIGNGEDEAATTSATVSLNSARERRDVHPNLAPYIRDDWLVTEARRGRALWHPLYDWLEAPAGHSDADATLDAIEGALGAQIGGALRSRAKRLTADRADFWSAIGELYLAARLSACGLEPALGSPDIVVSSGAGERLAIELNSIHATHDATRLQELLAARWTSPMNAILWRPDETIKIPLSRAGRVVTRVLDVAHTRSGVPVEIEDILGPGVRGLEVPIGDLIDPGTLRVFLKDGGPGNVESRSGLRSHLVDPWPDLERRLSEKLRQLEDYDCTIVAVEAGFAHAHSNVWAERAALGYGAPRLETNSNVAGLVLYWLDLRGHRPWKGYMFPNVAATCAGSSLLRDALACLGVATVPKSAR